MKRALAAGFAATLFLVACSQTTTLSTALPSHQATQASTSAMATAQSVICDFFAAGGPNDDFADAAIAAIDFAAGKIDDPSEAVATRDAINGTKELAARASGDERDDLLTLAEATDTAAMSGQGYVGWADASNAFYVKYAEQCGQEIAH